MNYIAIAGLLVALGATDDELEPTLAVLERGTVPLGIKATVQLVRATLESVRAERKSQ